MNKEWSELNKTMQLQLSKKDTFEAGIQTLLRLRASLYRQMEEFQKELSEEEFSLMPFMNAKGYHSKTVAYSLFHMFRIEDITANELIRKSEQVFVKQDHQAKMQASLGTTGNELVKEAIAEFSKGLKIDALYDYAKEVYRTTNEMLARLSYAELKNKMTPQDAAHLHDIHCVSEDENAVWLIDYWCGKNVKGLVQMPLSRHLIMHTEAAVRIKEKIVETRR